MPIQNQRANPRGAKILLLATLLLTSVLAVAQPKIVGEDEVKRSAQITSQLDSLLNVWYLKKTSFAKSAKAVNKYNYAANVVPSFSDSVYSERITRIESPLPLVYNPTVKAFIDLYTVRKRGQVQKMLGLAEYYFPIMEEILDRYNVPIEIKYLSIVESALNTRAVSRVGATGLWQFMYGTGVMYNLDVNSYIDYRKDPVKATEAAARYLRDLRNVFQDWFLAIAAYNCGPGNVNKAIRLAGGGKKTFWEIYNYLPVETRGYVPAFIAATYAFTYSQEHNLYPIEISLPAQMDTVKVTQELHLQTVANVLQMDMDLLKDLNPQYKKNIIPARGSSIYTLALPAEKATQFVTLRDSIYRAYNAVKPELPGERFVPGTRRGSSRKQLPKTLKARETESAEGSNEKVRVTYKVKSGDNLTLIADVFDMTTYDLRKYNNLRRSSLLVGQTLSIPVPKAEEAFYETINSMTMEQKKKLADTETRPTPAEPTKKASAKKKTKKKKAVKKKKRRRRR